MDNLDFGNLSTLQIVELIGVLLSIAYVVLASLKSIWCWLFGIVGSGISIYIFIASKLYAESVLFFYYVGAGFYGWYEWKQEARNEKFIALQYPAKKHFLYMLAGICCSFILAKILIDYTNALVPLADSFVTIFSFIATWLTIKKVIESWFYWLVIDGASIFLYTNRHLYFYAGLSILYTAISIYGYFQWKKSLGKELILTK